MLAGTPEEQLRGTLVGSFSWSYSPVVTLFLTSVDLWFPYLSYHQLLNTASFHYFDQDRNGILTKDELRLKLRSMVIHKFQTRQQLLSSSLQTEVYGVIDTVLDDVFSKADTDGSGGIDIEEYVKAFSGSAHVADFLKNL